MNEKDLALLALAETGVGPHKLRGQNFLVDEAVIRHIIQAAEIESDQTVLEIGPGLGALSRPLAQLAQNLALVEIEPALAARLRDHFAFEPQVTVYQADAVSFDYAQWCADSALTSYRVVANIPYHITTPLLRSLLWQGGPWESLLLMVQKEAAERICSGPGRDNGPLPLLAAYFGQAEQLFTVPPTAFYPKPAVTSAILRIRRRAVPPVAVAAEPLFRLIDAAFAQRRKVLLNNLAAWKGGREPWAAVLADCGFTPQVRAEQLTLTDFAALYQAAAAAGVSQ